MEQIDIELNKFILGTFIWFFGIILTFIGVFTSGTMVAIGLPIWLLGALYLAGPFVPSKEDF